MTTTTKQPEKASRPKPMTDPEKETYKIAMRLIKRCNRNDSNNKIFVDENVKTGVTTARIDFMHIPGSEEKLGVDSFVMAVTMFKQRKRTIKALPTPEFQSMMFHIEDIVRQATEKYHDTKGIRQGYYKCMYFGSSRGKEIQKKWERDLKCHRTFLVYYKDVAELAGRFASISEKSRFAQSWGVDDVVVVLNMPGHDHDLVLQSYI